MESIAGKKILFVITKSNWGGAQAYVYCLATHFSRKGARVIVALGGTGLPDAPKGLLAERLENADVRTIVVRSFARDISSKREFEAYKELRRIIRDERPDILHLNSSKAGGIGALAGRMEHVKRIIFTAHGWAHREPRSPVKRTLIWLGSWATVFFSHRVIVVSGRDYLDAPVLFSRQKFTVVHNGVASFPLLSRFDARKKLVSGTTLPENGFWILMQSELHLNKGVGTAIAALNLIAREYPDVMLVVLGDGEERTALEAQVLELKLTDRVYLLGFVPESRVYLRAADIFLISSRKEGMPMALLEAGVAGLAIVASKTGGIPEVITDTETGLLAVPDNPQAFASVLRVLIERPELRTTLGEKIAAHVEREFSEDRMISRTESVYLN